MNKTKTVFIVTFLVIIAFMLILSFYFTRAKNKKLIYLYGLGQPISRSINEEPPNAAIEIRFTKDDSKIITLLNNGKVELWDLSNKTKELISKTNKVFSYCADKNILVTSENNNIYLTDIISGNKRSLTRGKYQLASVDKNCEHLALIGDGNEVYVWNLKSNLLKSKLRTTLPARNGIAISPDGTKVAAAEGIYHEDKRRHETLIEVWDVASGNKGPVLTYDKRNSRLIVGVWNILFSSDSSKLLFDTQSSAESGIMLIDIQGSTVFEKSGFKSYWMRAADFNIDKNYLATGDEERNLVVWDLGSKEIGFYNKLPEVVESVSFSTSGSIIAAGIADSTIQVFRAEK
ncbi:MAG: hypothetical protein GWO07_11395 [Candidatus Dadabacteria bacterium]|nr:hypothetical protein [Candidatus Dadabacteria bacterium]NIS09344.1 hypothetical protein [Candidatus Dadabacteria bacterium]NIV42354.1 hypothetical protein [Candidatus Dadabacteria bacterium]NIX15880.1 hypothetical protein [Candidatus Dadabacteria bacterium]NIY22587.1 hypothetical protein [Candidatus Dadabacteria bacterium]